jgi:hypothetical protein
VPVFPPFAQITPRRIRRLNQADFLLATPALELFLAGDGIADVAEGFEVNQPVHVVLRGESGHQFVSVLKEPTRHIVRYADIEDTGLAGEDIDEVFAHMGSMKRQRSLDKLGMTNPGSEAAG